MCLITIIIAVFQEFDIINIMTQGGLGSATNMLVYRIYVEGFTNMKMGYASAIAYTLFAIIMVITLFQNPVLICGKKILPMRRRAKELGGHCRSTFDFCLRPTTTGETSPFGTLRGCPLVAMELIHDPQ